MNPVSLAMDGLLAVLLLTALAVGVRLNGRLRTLRASQGYFVKAVGDLDGAAARAEAGLASLRVATQEAHDALLSRIEAARALAPRLEGATTEAAQAAARLEEAVGQAEAAARRVQAAVVAAPRPAPSASVNEPIPFPRLRVDAPPLAEADPASARGLAAALAAAERIVASEAPVFPSRAEPLVLESPAEGRLARFVARRALRQGARA